MGAETRSRARSSGALPFHRKGGYRVLVFTGGSDKHWGWCVTQVPMAEFVEEVALADMRHEPLGFCESGVSERPGQEARRG